jgi:archaellum component FlaG (FlaF/FlaG flagellin family)
MKNIHKMYSLPERYVLYIKELAKKMEIAESDMIRRIIDVYIENQKNENK